MNDDHVGGFEYEDGKFTWSESRIGANAEIERLRDALRKLAVHEHVRMAVGGGTVPNGFSCEVCGVNCGGKLSELRHMSNCPLSFLNPK